MIEPKLMIYRVDGADMISFVDEAWSVVAAQSKAPELAGDKVLWRSLWDYIPDAGTRGIYRDLMEKARQGRSIRVPYRCDAPDRRRFLELELRAAPASGVEFRSHTVKIEAREPVALLDRDVPRSEDAVRMCAWCKKIPVEGIWLEIEDAVAELRLFERPRLPMLSHGICPACEEEMDRQMDA